MDHEQNNQQEQEQENVVDLPEKKPRILNNIPVSIGVHEEIKRLAIVGNTTQAVITSALIEQGLLASVNAAISLKAAQDKEAKEKKKSDIVVVTR